MHGPRPLLALLFPLLLVGCGGKQAAYRQPPVEPALVESPQDDRGMYLDLIRKMQAQGAHFASLAHIDAFRASFGDSPELRILQADALRETGDAAAAEPIYRSLTKGPQAAPAWHGLGLIAANQHDAGNANLAFANAVRTDPLNATYLGDQGFALLQSGDFAQARAPLAKAAELAPGNLRAISNLALWALLSGQPGTAQDMMQRANLPEATRLEIYRLSQSLRRAPVADATPPMRPEPASEAPAPRGTATALVAQPQPAGTVLRPQPPGSMLDRFSPTTAKPQEITQ